MGRDNLKRSIIFLFFIISTLILISIGCSNKHEPTISAKLNSEYENTFKKLNLGVLFNFDFYLPSADKRWVNLWVERYINGKKDSQPLTQLSYGNSPTDVDEGSLGFGMINPNSADTLVFLYGPGVSKQPKLIEKELRTNIISSWDYAIGKEKVELILGETKLLAAYRETGSNSIRTIDLQDEESVNRMINQDDMVLLLKIKVEEKK